MGHLEGNLRPSYIWDARFLKVNTDYEDFPLKFRYGGLHVKRVVATWNYREPSQHLLQYTRKPRKTCVEMVGHRTVYIQYIQIFQGGTIVRSITQSAYTNTHLQIKQFQYPLLADIMYPYSGSVSSSACEMKRHKNKITKYRTPIRHSWASSRSSIGVSKSYRMNYSTKASTVAQGLHQELSKKTGKVYRIIYVKIQQLAYFQINFMLWRHHNFHNGDYILNLSPSLKEPLSGLY